MAFLGLRPAERPLEVCQQLFKPGYAVLFALDDAITLSEGRLYAPICASAAASTALSASMSSARSKGKDMGIYYQNFALTAYQKHHPSQSTAAGGRVYKAVTRRQSSPANSASD